MQSKAVVVTGAAGRDETVWEVLQQAGYGTPSFVPSATEAVSSAREDGAALVVVPLEGPASVELTVLERELTRMPGTMVIATATHTAPELILRAMRAGVHEFLVSPVDPGELAGAVERLARRSRQDVRQGPLFAVFSAKGGLGTTSMAINLAWALAGLRPGRRTALADLVVNGGDVAVMLNLRPTYDISDLALKLDQLDTSVLESVLSSLAGNVSVLSASERPEALESVDERAAAMILSTLRANFDHVVADCEHHLSDRTLVALDAAERIVLVTQLNVAAMRSAQRSLALFRRLGFPDEKVAVVANRAQPGDLVAAGDVKTVLDRDLFHSLPNDYRLSEVALTRGMPVVAHEPESLLGRAYMALAAKLVGSEVGDAVPARINGQGSRLGRLFGLGRK